MFHKKKKNFDQNLVLWKVADFPLISFCFFSFCRKLLSGHYLDILSKVVIWTGCRRKWHLHKPTLRRFARKKNGEEEEEEEEEEKEEEEEEEEEEEDEKEEEEEGEEEKEDRGIMVEAFFHISLLNLFAIFCCIFAHFSQICLKEYNSKTRKKREFDPCFCCYF